MYTKKAPAEAEAYIETLKELKMSEWRRLKSPEGTAPGREIPLIGVADVSLRGLGSPEEGEQKTFWSPSSKRFNYLEITRAISQTLFE